MEKRKAYAKVQEEIGKKLKEKKAVFIEARTGQIFTDIEREQLFKPLSTPLQKLLKASEAQTEAIKQQTTTLTSSIPTLIQETPTNPAFNAPVEPPVEPAQTPQKTPPTQQPPITPAQTPITPAQTPFGLLTPPDSSKQIPENIVQPIKLAISHMDTFIKNTEEIEAQVRETVGSESKRTEASSKRLSALITATDKRLNLIRLDLRIALSELDKKYNSTEKSIEEMSEHIKKKNLLSSNSTLKKDFNKSFSEENLGLITAFDTYKFSTSLLSGEGITHKAIATDSSKSKKSSFLKGIVNTNGDFGNLNIDMNLLFLKHILKAKQKNKVVLQRNIDQSFIDLLTKRYYRTKKYSDLAKQVYSELVSLAGVNIHSTYTKSELIQGQGQGGIKIMRSADELVDKLEIIVGSRRAGNNSKEIINDGMEIIDTLLKEKAIDRVEHRTLYNKYFKY